MNEFIDWIMGIVTKNVTIAPSCASQPVADESGTANRTTGLLGGKATILSEVETSRLTELADYQRRPKPTPTERAEAWARNHRDYVPPEGESE